VGAFVLSHTMASLMIDLLYDLNVRDYATYAVVSLTFIATALLASALPARRAIRIDPASALRHE
jgi:ABC-type lipoprotein release transport system permease subunit